MILVPAEATLTATTRFRFKVNPCRRLLAHLELVVDQLEDGCDEIAGTLDDHLNEGGIEGGADEGQ